MKTPSHPVAQQTLQGTPEASEKACDLSSSSSTRWRISQLLLKIVAELFFPVLSVGIFKVVEQDGEIFHR